MSSFLDGLAIGTAVAAATAFIGAGLAYRFVPPPPGITDRAHPSTIEHDVAILPRPSTDQGERHMATYCLFDNIEVTDPDALAEYASRAAATVEQHGGIYLLIGGDFERKEGTWQPTFPVLIEFPDRAAADAWYDSPEYAPLKALRQSAGTFNAVFIDDKAAAASAA